MQIVDIWWPPPDSMQYPCDWGFSKTMAIRAWEYQSFQFICLGSRGMGCLNEALQESFPVNQSSPHIYHPAMICFLSFQEKVAIGRQFFANPMLGAINWGTPSFTIHDNNQEESRALRRHISFSASLFSRAWKDNGSRSRVRRYLV